MKLKMLKQFILVGLLIISVSACVVRNDDKFNLVAWNYYVLQEDEITPTDTISKYAPYFTFGANQDIQEGSLKTLTGKSYPLIYSGSQSALSIDLSVSSVFSDTIPNGNYEIKVVNKSGDFDMITLKLNVLNPIGTLDYTKLAYTAKDGIKAAWFPSKNANVYYILVSEGSEKYTPKKLVYSYSSTTDEATVSYNTLAKELTPGKNYRAVYAAGYINSSNQLQILLESAPIFFTF